MSPLKKITYYRIVYLNIDKIGINQGFLRGAPKKCLRAKIAPLHKYSGTPLNLTSECCSCSTGKANREEICKLYLHTSRATGCPTKHDSW